MTCTKTKRVLLWSVFGLVIVTATALGAKVWLSVPKPPTSITEQSPENRSCEERYGPHAIWNGTARSVFDEANNEQLIPNCSCAEGYQWINTDGTIGLTLADGSSYNIIDGPGECVRQ